MKTRAERSNKPLGVVLAGCLIALTAAACRATSTNGDTASSNPRSTPRVATVPAGTMLAVELLDTVGSDRSEAGDRVRGRVARDVIVGGEVVIPAGSSVSGVVTEARGLKKIGGRALLGVEFNSVDPPAGAPAELRASYHAAGKSETKKDAATIGGAAAGGAVLGRVVGHQHDNDTKGTVIGAVVGGAAGTAIAAKTKGEEIVLPAGQILNLALENSVQLTVGG